jgi:hypothetical protein
MSEIKPVVWTITNAEILAGKGEKATGDQPIFLIRGTITRSDYTNGPLKGEIAEWTPNDKAKGFELDLSKFDRKVNKGTILIKGFVGKGGRKVKSPVTPGTDLDSILALA